MNEVEIDPIALDGEVDRLIAGAAPELTADPNAATAPGTGELVGNAGPGSWIEVTPGLVVAADVLVLPQWNLREDEKQQLGEALAGVLDQLFPGGIGDARWAPYFRLVAVSMAIALSRRDPLTGKFPPIGPMKRAEQATDAAATSAGDRRAA